MVNILIYLWLLLPVLSPVGKLAMEQTQRDMYAARHDKSIREYSAGDIHCVPELGSWSFTYTSDSTGLMTLVGREYSQGWVVPRTIPVIDSVPETTEINGKRTRVLRPTLSGAFEPAFIIDTTWIIDTLEWKMVVDTVRAPDYCWQYADGRSPSWRPGRVIAIDTSFVRRYPVWLTEDEMAKLKELLK